MSETNATREPTPLEKLFAAVWEYARDGENIDGDVLQDMLEKADLIVYTSATEAEVEASQHEIELGDPVLRLTAAGHEAVLLVHAMKSK